MEAKKDNKNSETCTKIEVCEILITHSQCERLRWSNGSVSQVCDLPLSLLASFKSKLLTCGYYCLQCFDAVGWATGRASGL